jgi:dimethylsulfone monooxygenase
MGGTRMSPEVRQHMSDLSAATPGLPLVGTASAIADQIAAIHGAGVDGLALSWADPGSGVEPFIAEVLPELERNGARKRTSVASSAAGASE